MSSMTVNGSFTCAPPTAWTRQLIDALTQRRIGLDEPNVAQALAQPEPIQVADLRDEAPNQINEITLRAGYLARLVAPLRRAKMSSAF